MPDLIGVNELFDAQGFGRLAWRFVVDLLFAGVVIRAYARLYRQREYVFTYFMFNVITFSLCFLLRKVPIELGFALGLFAVFGILRYRTEPIRIRDLTYLFIVIGLAILNAVANEKVSLAELVLVNGVIVGMTLLLEWAPFIVHEESQEIIYDNLDLLRAADEKPLLADLAKRTGLDVRRVSVRSIDLLRHIASVTVFYEREDQR